LFRSLASRHQREWRDLRFGSASCAGTGSESAMRHPRAPGLGTQLAPLAILSIVSSATGEDAPRVAQRAPDAPARDTETRKPPPAPEPREPALVSREFHAPEAGSTVHWDLLRLPELATRLALTPLFPLIIASEQVRLDLRLYDLVTNPERTRILLPLVTAYTKDGVGAGLLYAHSDAFGGGETIDFFALTTTNRDVEVSGPYSEDVALLDGRALGT